MAVGLRQEAIEYLVHSGFVNAYVKKLMFQSDIDNLYEDYVQEAFLTILELKDSIWEKLYNSSIEKETDYHYEVRNYVSRVIYNTVHSSSSNAYRKLKKSAKYETTQDDVKWDVLNNTVADPKTIIQQIQEL